VLEGESKLALEQLSEADRQAFIDLTIEDSAKKPEQDAQRRAEEISTQVE